MIVVKIVLLSTHDPLLALLAPRRICLKNGGMFQVRLRSDLEQTTVHDLELIDQKVTRARGLLREGYEVC